MSKSRTKKANDVEQSPVRVGNGLPESHRKETDALLACVRRGQYEKVLVDSSALLGVLDVSEETEDLLKLRSAARARLFRYEALVKRGHGMRAQAIEEYDAACDLTLRSGLTANMSRLDRIRALAGLIEYVVTGESRHLSMSLHAVEAAEAHAELLRGLVADENLIVRQLLECGTVRAEVALAFGDPMTADRCIVEHMPAVSIWEIDSWNKTAHRCIEAIHYAYVTPDEPGELERRFRIGYDELESLDIAFDRAWYAYHFGKTIRSIEWLERAAAGFRELGSERLCRATEEMIGARTERVGPSNDERNRRLLEAVGAAYEFRKAEATSDDAVEPIVVVGNRLQAVYDEMFDLVWNRGGAPIVLEGETGTGKGELALISHFLSGRNRTGAFVTVDFQDPSELIQDKLYGHKKGAFTGAVSDAKGLLAEAEGGTLFLDEIDKAPAGVLDKFLLTFDRGTYRRHGESVVKRMNDVQLIFASSTSIQRLVDDGKMRKDMMYRILRGGRLVVPSLRENRALIQVLARRVAERTGAEWGTPHFGIDRDAWDLILNRDWEGNARELEKVIRFAVRRSVRRGSAVVTRASIVEAIADHEQQMDRNIHGRTTRLEAVLGRYPALRETIDYLTGTTALGRREPDLRAALRDEMLEHAIDVVGDSSTAIANFLGGVTPSSVHERLEVRQKRQARAGGECRHDVADV